MSAWSDDFPQSDRDLEDIGRRREIPPDEPYAHGPEYPDDPSVDEDYHDCNESTRIVSVYRERRLVCNVCDRVLKINVLPYEVT